MGVGPTTDGDAAIEGPEVISRYMLLSVNVIVVFDTPDRPIPVPTDTATKNAGNSEND